MDDYYAQCYNVFYLRRVKIPCVPRASDLIINWDVQKLLTISEIIISKSPQEVVIKK